MNFLIVLQTGSEFIELTFSEPYTYMLFGFFSYAFAIGATLLRLEPFIYGSICVGSAFLITALMINLYQIGSYTLFYILLTILLFSICFCVYLLKRIKSKFK